MKNRIEILCPSRRCPRCKKMTRYIEGIVDLLPYEVEIVVLTNLQDFIKFRTWILPSVFVNGKKVSRGYKPKKDEVIRHLVG